MDNSDSYGKAKTEDQKPKKNKITYFPWTTPTTRLFAGILSLSLSLSIFLGQNKFVKYPLIIMRTRRQRKKLAKKAKPKPQPQSTISSSLSKWKITIHRFCFHSLIRINILYFSIMVRKTPQRTRRKMNSSSAFSVLIFPARGERQDSIRISVMCANSGLLKLSKTWIVWNFRQIFDSNIHSCLPRIYYSI